MKKTALIVVFTLLSCYCFAKGKWENFEVGAASPYFVEKANVSGIDVKTRMPAWAINFSGVSYYTETLGSGLYANLIFPQKIKISSMGQSVEFDKSEYDFLLAADVLVGPVFMVYENGNFALPVAAGFHCLQLWSSANSLNASCYELGFGTNVTGEYHITRNIYFLARFQLTFDFFSIDTEEQYVGHKKVRTVNSGTLAAWGVNPTVGIGFHF